MCRADTQNETRPDLGHRASFDCYTSSMSLQTSGRVAPTLSKAHKSAHMSSASSPPNPQPTAHGAAQEPVPTFYNVIHLEEEIERRKMTLIAQSAVRSPPNWDEEV